jgi:hypothetical protein
VTQLRTAHVVSAAPGADDEVVGVGPMLVPRGMFRMIPLGVIHTPDLRPALRRLIEFTRIGMGLEAAEMIGHLSSVPCGQVRVLATRGGDRGLPEHGLEPG